MISIIIPIYNKEKYLERCLNSIISQSYPHFELLLIDDGSTDRSGSICDEYVKKDDRVKVFHQLNGGVSSARNKGLENSNGEWICFIDADDWVDKDYLQNFTDELKPDTQLVLQNFWLHEAGNDNVFIASIPDTRMVGNYKLIKWLEETPGVHNGFIWHRLFRADIINRENARFPLGISYAEDGIFWLSYLHNANIVEMTSKPGYHYTYGIKNSLTSRGKKLPVETMTFILRKYVELMIGLDVPQSERKKHLNFVRQYMWRFIIDFLQKYSKQSDSELLSASNNIVLIARDYSLYDFVSRNVSVNIIKAVITIKKHSTRIRLIKAGLSLNSLERKIVGKFRSLKNKK